MSIDLEALSVLSWVAASDFELTLSLAEIEEALRKGLTPAAKYRRISDDREGRELGITRQDDDLDKLAAREGLVWVASYVDNDISASTRTRKLRPAYRQMLRDAKAGHFKVISAATTNRLTRKPRERETLIELAMEHGIRYLYDKSPSFDLNTAHGRMVARMLADVDTGEAEIIAERVATAYAHRILNGGFAGGQRFGFGVPKVDDLGRPWVDDDGKPLVDWSAWVPELAKEIATAAHAVLAGTSCRSIMKDWDRRGIKPLRAKEWSSRSFNSLLTRPANAGLVVHKGQIVEGVKTPWEPIIDRETWKTLKMKLSDPSRKKSPGNKPQNLLAGEMRCGHPQCVDDPKADMRLGRRTGTARNNYAAYRCRVKGHNWIKADETEAYIQEIILRWLEKPETADIMQPIDETKAAELAIRANGLRDRLAGVKRGYVDGIYSEAEMRTAVSELKEQLATIEQAQAEMAGVTPLYGIAGKSDARERWFGVDGEGGLSLGQKKAIMRLLLQITILPSPRRGGKLANGQRFDYSRIVVKPTEHMTGA